MKWGLEKVNELILVDFALQNTKMDRWQELKLDRIGVIKRSSCRLS
ncbi:Uncharacterised protein [uncultured archaeon]|nr:Uncharacterised protein [uncultured archaeon]